MNIKNLKYFIEVVKYRSFNEASKKIFLSQPTLSKAIQSLEEELDILLIDRTSKKFKLTPDGERFYENAIHSKKIIDDEFSKLRDSLTLKKGKITIGIPPIVVTAYFVAPLNNFKELYPDFTINITVDGGKKIQNEVISGDLDIGIVTLPIKSKEFNVIQILKSKLVCVVNSKHKLSSKNSISILDIKDDYFIIANEKYFLHDRIKEICYKYEFEPNIIETSSEWDFILEMIYLNKGVTILPKPLFKKMKLKDIKILNLIEPDFNWNIGLITKKDKYISSPVNTLINFFKNIFI